MASAPTGRRTLEVAEEIAFGRHDHDIAVLAQRILVRLETAIEGIELGVAVIRGGVDGCGGRITFTADALRVGERPGDELGLLALGFGLDDLRFTIAFT